MKCLFTNKKTQIMIYSIVMLVLATVMFMTRFNHPSQKHIQSQPKMTTDHKKNSKKPKKVVKKVEKNEKPITRHYNIKRSPQTIAVTGATLDQKLKGNLEGLGSEFVEAGKKNQIDPSFLVALAAQETGWGNSEISSPPINNVGGITCMPKQYKQVFGPDYPNPGCAQIVAGGTKWQKFNSIEDSIHFKAAYLKNNYVDEGKDTIAEIKTKYAPNNANNDKQGLNNYWEKNIVAIMKNLKKDATNL